MVTKKSMWVLFAILVISAWVLWSAAPALAQMQMHVIPFDSVTLSSQQVLLGEMQGKPVTLAGELRLPHWGTDKVPVVILVHGIGGLSAKEDEWARALNSWGIGVFIPDHLSGRGIAPLSSEDYMLSGEPRMVNVYRSLSLLSRHPRIDPERIAIMGFSLGGQVTLLSSQERFLTRYGLPNVQFAAYIALYAFYPTRFRDDVKVAARPIRLFHGTADDWCPVEWCRVLVADLKKAGADATLTEYPGATHAYDDPGFKVRVNFPQAVSLRKCSLAEGEGGQIMNSQTGKLFAPGDPCIEFGVSLQYDEAATASTREAVKGVLASAFAAKPAAAAPTAAVAKAFPPIPADLQIVQPDPSLPKELSAFFGKWEWISNPAEFFIIVEKIDAEKASLYVWRSGSWLQGTPMGWERVEAKVTKGHGKYKLSYGDDVYTLMGEYLSTYSASGSSQLRRVP